MENNTTVIMLTLLECYRDENKSELGGEEKKIIRKHGDWKREMERDKKARVDSVEQLHDEWGMCVGTSLRKRDGDWARCFRIRMRWMYGHGAIQDLKLVHTKCHFFLMQCLVEMSPSIF